MATNQRSACDIHPPRTPGPTARNEQIATWNGSVDDVEEYPLETIFALFEMAVRMRGERHRSDHPEATEAEVDAVVQAWLSHRPGAEFGDAEGVPGDLARFQ